MHLTALLLAVLLGGTDQKLPDKCKSHDQIRELRNDRTTLDPIENFVGVDPTYPAIFRITDSKFISKTFAAMILVCDREGDPVQGLTIRHVVFAQDMGNLGDRILTTDDLTSTPEEPGKFELLYEWNLTEGESPGTYLLSPTEARKDTGAALDHAFIVVNWEDSPKNPIFFQFMYYHTREMGEPVAK